MQGVPARTLTTTSFVILGQLALQRWSIYELAQHMRRNLRYIWPRAESGIYAEAKALVALGMAEAEKGFVGKRPRTMYRITTKGRHALRDWLASPPKPGLAVDLEALVRVFLGNFAEAEDLVAAVGQTRVDAAGLVSIAHEVAREYIEGRAPFQPHVHVRAFVFDFLFTFGHMVHDWSERTARDLEGWTQLDVDERRELGRSRIAGAIAKRPGLPTVGSEREAHRPRADHGPPPSPPPRRKSRVTRTKRTQARTRSSP
jgi:PadR family transcriptional regulator, regulatory protein AphA